MSYNRFQHSNFNEVFGKLESVHPVRRNKFQTFGIPALLAVPMMMFFVAYLETKDWLVLPVCVLPFLILLIGVIWNIFSTRRDALRIYENGFTARSERKLQICLWTEIKEYKRQEQTARQTIELENGELPLGSIEKKTGEIIVFDHDLPGTTEIIKRFENRRKKK